MAAPSVRWQGLRQTGKQMTSGEPEPGDPIVVSCSHQVLGICLACADDLRRVLADVPMLLDDLDVAIAGETSFVEHGAVKRDDAEDDDAEEDPRRGQNPAVLAQQRLTEALTLASRWIDNLAPKRLAAQLALRLNELASEPEIRRVAREVSQAAKRAHRVIDRPRDLWFYGPCPECGHDIRQERIAKDDTTTPVACRWPKCGYAAPVDVHYKRQLDAAEDKQMTITELVAAFEMAGEPVTRKQIQGWIRHHGLPRETRPIVKWVDGKLEVTDEVDTYRVGDVRDMAARVEMRRRGLRNAV